MFEIQSQVSWSSHILPGVFVVSDVLPVPTELAVTSAEPARGFALPKEPAGGGMDLYQEDLSTHHRGWGRGRQEVQVNYAAVNVLWQNWNNLQVSVKDAKSVSLYPYNRSQILQYVKYSQ